MSWKARAQSVMVILLILVPVAAVTSAATLGQSRIATAAEQVTMRLGQTQAELQVVSPPDRTLIQEPTQPQSWQVNTDPATRLRTDSDLADPLLAPSASLPPGTEIIEVSKNIPATVETASGRGSVLYVEGDVADPALAGAYTLRSGRAAQQAGEVLVTPSALTRLGKKIGSTFDIYDPAPVTVTIVGTINESMRPDSIEVIYGAGGTLLSADANLKGTRFFLPDFALSWDQVSTLNQSGLIVWSKAVLLDPPPSTEFQQVSDGERATAGLITGIALFAVFEVCLLAGAAFMVGARQNQRTLALLGSVGAERRDLFAVITSTGLVLGAAAALGGVLIGIAAAFLLFQLADNGNASEYPGFHVNGLVVLLIAALSVLVAWVASLIPAMVASKVDVATALKGATRPARSHRTVTRIGVAALLIGIGTVTVATLVLASTDWVRVIADSTLESNPVMIGSIITISIASVLIQVAAILLVFPLLKLIAHRLRNSPLPVKLAARDLTRHAGRTVPVIAVVMSTISIAVVTMSFQASQQAVSDAYRSGQALVGQGFLPIFTFNEDIDAKEVRAAAPLLAAAVEKAFDTEQVRIVQRPQTDYSAWVTGTGTYTEIKPARTPETICPLDRASPDYLDTEDPAQLEQERFKYEKDPRCDPRNIPANFIGSGPGTFDILIGDTADLEQITGQPIPESAKSTLANGGAIAFWPQLVNDGQVTLEWNEMFNLGATRTVSRAETLPGELLQPEERLLIGAFISKATAIKLGMTPAPGELLASFDTAPTVNDVDALNEQIEAILPGVVSMIVASDGSAELRTANWITLLLVLLVAIAAAAIAIGLSRVEGRGERATLHAVGASPQLTQRMSAAQAAIIILIAASIGTVAGLIPIYCIFGITDIGFRPPWIQLLVIIIGLPLFFAAAAWLIQPLKRPRGTRTASRSGQLLKSAMN